jgi:hypothetical protein
MSAILKNVVVLMVEHICMLKLSKTSFFPHFCTPQRFSPFPRTYCKEYILYYVFHIHLVLIVVVAYIRIPQIALIMLGLTIFGLRCLKLFYTNIIKQSAWVNQ